MTAQFSDTFVFMNEEWNLSGIKGNELFPPEKIGLTPVSWCTPCWRGYLASYEVVKNQILIKSLEICLTEPQQRGGGGKKVPAPEITGIKPTECNNERSFFEYAYEGLNLLIPFSGGLILTKEFIDELYVHMGFHPAWKYRRVYELIFDKGALLESKNLSEEMERLREKLSKKPLKPNFEDTKEFGEWIKKSFSLDYDF